MRRSGIQLAYPFEEKRLAKWQPPYLVQPKLDGVRCRALPIGRDKSYTLVSSEENFIHGMSHVEDALESLPFRVELDGELYCHGMPFEEIFSRTSRGVNYHPDARQIGYFIFDICDEQMPQIKRTNWLFKHNDLFRNPLWLVTTMVAKDLDEVLKCYDMFCSAEYEGIIVRHTDAPYVRRRSTYMMKFKPKQRDEYLVVGWKEELSIEGVPKGRLGALICESDGEQFSVGTGLTVEDREGLWDLRDSLIGKIAVVDYQHTTAGRKVPRFPVLVSLKEKEVIQYG